MMRTRTALMIVAGIALVILGWMAVGAYTVAGIEQPKYEKLADRDGYELRRYAPMIVAETDMQTLGVSDRGSAFRTIAGYIFGGNATRDKVAMTAPVVMDAPPAGGSKIAMTAPVVMTPADPAQPGASNPPPRPSGTMRFVMPAKFKSVADLPVPLDPRVRLIEVPARTIAVSAFSWWATDSRVAAKTAELLAALARDNAVVAGQPALASYNPPFTPPFMQRHEIMIEVKADAR